MPAAASEPRWRRPSQKTGSAPSETTTTCANASASGDGHDEPQRREQREERIDVPTEPHHLLAGRAVR